MGKIEQALAKASGSAPAPSSPAVQHAEPQQPEPVATTPSHQATAEPPVPALDKWNDRLQLATAPLSIVAESFRKIRNSILHPASGSQPRTILVTSAVPEEGKTFICANLGISLAQGLEQHCLLVDCDLRRPTLASLFGLGNDTGLADYLRGQAPLSSLIQKTGLAKLSLIPSGPAVTNPAELLDSTVMQHTIMEMASRYPDRYILFDSPPGQAAAETAVLAKHVDAVVVVVRWGKSGREQVKQLVETIGREKILGVVFNAYELSGLDKALYKKGYYGYYGYGYYNTGT